MNDPARISGDFFHRDRPLFTGLDLSLAPNGWTCLLGASGAGKSTILRLFAGLETGGRFKGEITRPKGRLAYMAQNDLLMPWATALENVVLGAQLRGDVPDYAKARGLLHDVGLTGYEGHKPASLSGGMRQRVALARTLMEDSPLVLLDEPFSALDARTRADMQALSYRLLEGRSVLLVTHDPLEAARLARTCYLLGQEGVKGFEAPSSTAPRALTDAGVLALHDALMAQLGDDAEALT